MTKILFFSGVPLNDSATLYRTGLVAKKLQGLNWPIIFTSVSANFQDLSLQKISELPVLFIGQAHYFAQKPFSFRQRLGLIKTLVENLKTCYRFAKIVKKEKPDKVFVVTVMPVSLLIGLVSKILGFKTLIDIEDLAIGQMEAAGYSRFLISVYGFVERQWVRIFDKIAVCSHYLVERYPGSFFLPNMVEIGWWTQHCPPSSRLAGLRRDFAKLVFVGQMGPYHGQREVLQALAPVVKKKNLRLVFVGGGEQLRNLKSQISNLKLEKQIIFTEQVSQNEVRKILAKSDIGLLPLWDTPVHQARHPLKLLEYLAAGLVVITNNVGEIGRMIRDSENGILCPAGDINCLAKKIEEILADQDTAQKISQKAQLTAQEFSSEKILPQWVKCLKA